MGITGLWELVSPASSKVPVTDLAGSRVAVDASIWIAQFVSQLTDDKGGTIPNVHIIGFVKRILRLYKYKLFPVFVFDGNPPKVKLETLNLRAKQRLSDEINIRKATDKLVRKFIEKQDRTVDSGLSAIDILVHGKTPVGGDLLSDRFETLMKEESGIVSPSRGTLSTAIGTSIVIKIETEFGNVNQYTVSDLSWLQTLEFNSLDAVTRYKILTELRDQIELQTTTTLASKASNISEYSEYQVSNYMAGCEFNQVINSAKKDLGQAKFETATQPSAVKSDEAPQPEDEFMSFMEAEFNYTDSMTAAEPVQPVIPDNELVPQHLRGGKKRAFTSTSTGRIWNRIRTLRKKPAATLNETWFCSKIRAARDIATKFTTTSAHEIIDSSWETGMLASLTDKPVSFAQNEVQYNPAQVEVWQTRSKISLRKLEEDHSPIMGMPISEEQPEPSLSAHIPDLENIDGWNDWEDLEGRPVGNLHSITETEDIGNASDFSCKLATTTNTVVATTIEGHTSQEHMPDVREPARHVSFEAVAAVAAPGDQRTSIKDSKRSSTTEAAMESHENLGSTAEPTQPFGAAETSVACSKLLARPATRSTIPREEVFSDPNDSHVFGVMDSQGKGLADPQLWARFSTDFGFNLKNTQCKQPKRMSADHNPTEDAQLGHTNKHQPAKLRTGDRTCKNHSQSTKAVVNSTRMDHDADFFHHSLGVSGTVASAMPTNDPLASLDAAVAAEIIAVPLPDTSAAVDIPDTVISSALRRLQLQTNNSFESRIWSVPEKALPKLSNKKADDATGFIEEAIQGSASLIENSSRHELYDDIRRLLEALGIPFINAPAEAEAQCCALARCGIVDAVVSEDSDCLAFGSPSTIRRLFINNGKVELFQAGKIVDKLKLSREKIIGIAMLVGCDYTSGIHGVGIVNALETIAAWGSSLESLMKFKTWARQLLNLTDPGVTAEDSAQLIQYKNAHKTYRRFWRFPQNWPDPEAYTALLNPFVDLDAPHFVWAKPLMNDLRLILSKKCGLLQKETQSVLDDLSTLYDDLKNCRRQVKLTAFLNTHKFEHGEHHPSKRIAETIGLL